MNVGMFKKIRDLVGKNHCFFLLFFCKIALAAEQEKNCWVEAGLRYNLNPHLLYAIADKESSLNPKAIGYNKNGSQDLGLMQINSSWLPALARFGIRRDHLWEPCTNIHVGAWILAQAVSKIGYNWSAVGAYNTGVGVAKDTESKRIRYSSDVYRRLERVLKSAPTPGQAGS